MTSISIAPTGSVFSPVSSLSRPHCGRSAATSTFPAQPIDLSMATLRSHGHLPLSSLSLQQSIRHKPKGLICPTPDLIATYPACYTHCKFQVFYTSASAMHGCRLGGGGKVGPDGVAGEGAESGPGELLAGPDRPQPRRVLLWPR
jgi:hypothetical protein